MKKPILLIILSILFSGIYNLTNSQTITVTVGNLNFYNPSYLYPAPYGRYYESTHQQFLIRASELLSAGAEAGEIESIAFYVMLAITGGDPLPDYTIKMKHTSDLSITTIDTTGLIEVDYSSSYTASLGWNTHYFNTPFLWDGYSNIIVDICNDISLNSSTNYNSGSYHSMYSYNCYVYGVSNTTNQCNEDFTTDYLYSKPDFKMVITPSVPNCAIISSPNNQATNISRTAILNWNAGSNYITDYDVYFGSNPNPPFVTNTTSTSYNPGTMDSVATYYWKIVPNNISGGAIGCNVWSFTTNSGLTDCSGIVYPPDGSIDILLNPVLDWQSTSNAISYNIYAGTNPNPGYIDNTTGTSYNANFANDPNTTYYWRIEPVSIYGGNDTCDVQSFITYSFCPENPVPSTGQTNLLTYQTLSWDSVPSAEMYYIYLSKNLTPELIDSSLSNSFYITDLDPNSQYYWKIDVKLGSTVTSGCDLWTFSTTGNSHWFIKTNGNNVNDGLSWDQAKSSLSELMYLAECGDSIHIAEGNYYPVIDTVNQYPTNARMATFPLRGGVDLLGGYPGSASGSNMQSSLLVSRDYEINTTVLNGNIGTVNSNTDNCYHVITMFGNNNGTALIDGFEIINGYSNFNYNYDYYGAAIHLQFKKLSIKNCYFTNNNTAQASGIYAKHSELDIENSRFSQNYLGAAVYANSYSKLRILNSYFFQNYQAVLLMNYSSIYTKNSTYWWNTSNSSDIEMVNCGNDTIYSSYFISSTISQLDKSYGGHAFIDNSILGGASSASFPSQIYYKYSVRSSTYYDANGTGTSIPQYAYWLEYPPVDNGGNTLTCKLKYFNGENPAVATGNPEYGGELDQRGVVRGEIPCLGAYEAPYSTSSDIIINDTSLCYGQSATYNVSSNTISNPIFKWYSNPALTTLLNTGNTYNAPPAYSSLNYYITVENDSIYPTPQQFAKVVFVYVGNSPLIDVQPLPINECSGTTAHFSVDAHGKNLTYQWLKDNLVLTGETDSILSFASISENDNGMYYCEISSSCGGSANTNTVELNCYLSPEIVNNLQNDTIILNDNAIFSIAAIGEGIQYLWQVDYGNGFIDLSNTYPFMGANTNTLTIENAQDTMSMYNFRCIVTGFCEPVIISDTANFVIVIPPQININVQNQIACINEPVFFIINAQGTNIEYQWQIDEGNGFYDLVNNSTYTNCQNDTLGINNVTILMSGNQYRCIIFNNVDSVFSDTAYLFIDDTNPVISSIHNDLIIDADTNCELILPDYTGDINATDNCDTNLVYTQMPVAGTTISGITNNITLIVTDNAGNSDEAYFNIEVVDNINPIITSIHNNQIIDANTNCEANLPDYIGQLIATDNCDTSLSATQNPVAGTIISGIINIVTLTVMDNNGNIDEVTFNIEVIDNDDPVITSGFIDQINDANGNCEVELLDYSLEVIAFDNCDTNLIVTQNPTPGTIISGAINQITLTVTDDAGNNVLVSFNIEVVDNTNPIFISTHNDQIIGNGSDCDVNLPDYIGDVIASDNCDTILSVMQTPVAGTLISGITNVVTLTVTDNSGNSEQVNFNVGVSDNEDPIITSIHIDQYIDANTNCEAVLQDYISDVTAIDNCDTILNVIQSPVAGTTISGMTNVVTLTITDNSGNSEQVNFNVGVFDNIDPNITCVDNQIVIATEINTYTVIGTEFDPVLTNDNCSIASILNDYNSSSILESAIFQVGSTDVTWTIEDENGNTNSCIFNIIVNEIVGINDLQQNGILIYPNPTNRILNFVFTYDNIQKITISDINGKQLIIKTNINQNETVDLYNLENAIYFITIQTDKGVFKTVVVKI